MKYVMRLSLFLLLMVSKSVLSQTDSLLCFPLEEGKELLASYESDKICDSLIQSLEKENKAIEQKSNEQIGQISDLQGMIENDSIQKQNMSKIIDMCDKKNKKLKTQRNVIGVVSVILLLFAIIF